MRDALTTEECVNLVTSIRAAGHSWLSFLAALQAAARLGAERERERAARVCEQAWPEMYKWWGDAPWRAACEDCAAAIRRGEEG